MKNLYLQEGPFPQGFFDGAVARIVELQRADGSIPWFDGGVVDPWNHTEAAMGLATAGERARAEKAFAYLAETQLEDGSWHGQYGSAVPMDESHYTGDGNEKKIRDTNFSAYIATGIWHHYLLFQDDRFLDLYWPIIARAMEFVLSLQTEHGDIRWAANDPHTPEDDALITGCSSIYKSLECAIRLAEHKGAWEQREHWAIARSRLGHALRNKPERFDRDWEEKSRFSMDWYYPVLSGVLTGDAAKARLGKKWDIFVAEGKDVAVLWNSPGSQLQKAASLP